MCKNFHSSINWLRISEFSSDLNICNWLKMGDFFCPQHVCMYVHLQEIM